MLKIQFVLYVAACIIPVQSNFYQPLHKSTLCPRAEVPKIDIDTEAVDTLVKNVLDCKDSVSAVSVAIVQLDEEDNLVDEYNNGYGILDPVNPEDSDADEFTNFCIGSINKQFTAGLVGLALEKHGMDFDTKLIDLLGESGRFFNEKGLDQMPTVRDLLSHRMAIPRFDTAWMSGLNGTRLDYWPKLHNLADISEDYISHKYRSSFVYNNWMVSLAGYITELLTNQTYEAGIIEKYYIPLELDNATFANLQWYNRSKAALPAYRVVDYSAPPQNFSWLPLSVDFLRETIEKVSPSGSICLSSNDMRKYMRFLLNSTSKNDEERLLKGIIKQTMFETSNFIQALPEPEGPFFSSDTYALGWVQGIYRGYETVFHGGAINGYFSFESIFPKLKLGIFVSSTNGLEDNDKSELIAQGLFDMVMNQTTDTVTSKTICAVPDSLPGPNPDSLPPYTGCFDTTQASFLEPLAGTYHHEVFSDIIVRYDKDAEKERRFTFEYGKFFHGILCPKPEDKNLTEFQLYFDADSPLWFANDLNLSEGNKQFDGRFLFVRDKANRGTSFIFPGMAEDATTQKQTFYKKGYHPCGNPNPCKNGGTCFLYGELDFICSCPPAISGILCEETPLTDCLDWKTYHPDSSVKSGVYPIKIPGINELYNVYCDMDDDGGGWTVVHRRLEETTLTSFNVKFDQYVHGFGKPGEFHSYWIGLDALYHLTGSADRGYTLKISLGDCNNRNVTEVYEGFWIGDNSTQFTLHLKPEAATGTAGDALTISNSYFNHNNMKFSTPDKDDPNNCASTYNSGWWFNDCFAANLNGIYYKDCKPSQSKTDGITWMPFHNNKYSLKSAQMKIRRDG